MRKTTIRVIGWLLILCLFLPATVAEGFSKAEWYEMGMSSLEEMTEESTEEAVAFFEAAGNYEQAKDYRIYAQALSEILSLRGGKADPEMALIRLQSLARIPEFTGSLAAFDLPSCGDLITYLEAYQSEQGGDYYTAWKKYAGVRNVLDAVDRMFEMIPRAYEQADQLDRQGEYEAASKIFGELNWKDSAERSRQAFSEIRHEWVEADCENPRRCTLHGETEGEPLGHNWAEATYREPKKCTRCGKTEGEARGIFGFHMTMAEVIVATADLLDLADTWTVETAPQTLNDFPFFPDDLAAATSIVQYARASLAPDGSGYLFNTNIPDYLTADPPSFSFLQYAYYDSGSDTIVVDGTTMDNPYSQRFIVPNNAPVECVIYDSTWVTGELLSDIHFEISFFAADNYVFPYVPGIYLWYQFEGNDYYCLGWNWEDEENIYIFFRHLSDTSNEDWRCWYTEDPVSGQMKLNPEKCVFQGQITDYDPYFY